MMPPSLLGGYSLHVGSVMPFPDKDAAALKKVVGMAVKDNMLVAEVGSWTGKSTGVIAKNVLSRHGHVYAIDHWQGSIDVWQYDVAKKYNIFSVFRKNMDLLGVSDAGHPLVPAGDMILLKSSGALRSLMPIVGNSRTCWGSGILSKSN